MTSRRRGRSCLVVAWAAIGCLIGCAAPALAQADRAATPGFSLASSTIFTTRESPSIYLTFQKVERLDFRIYKVRDPMAFVAGLKDPHQLGSETPPVDQEPTTLERVASWKATWRWRLRNFVRRQFSHDYRQARRRQDDQQRVVRRRTEQVSTFAQVPLLNRSQLVTSWREILPPMRDPEVRRIPLELTAPGMYVVEAVSPPHRAYTVVIISDVGLVSKAAPGQVLLYAADRRTGTPVAGCEVRVIANQQPVVSGTTGADGVFMTTLEQTAADDVVSVARCGEQVTASDPGGWYLRESPRELVGYVFTDKPIYRPGHTVHLKALLRWRTRGALMPFDAADVEVRISDVTDKVIYRQRKKVDAFGGISADVPLGSGVALGDYSIAVLHGDDTASGGFEVQEYRKPEFEVRVSPAERFVVQGGQYCGDGQRALLLRAAGRQRQAYLRRAQTAVLLALAVERRGRGRRRGLLVRRRSGGRGHRAARCQRQRHHRGAGRGRRQRTRLQPANRGAGQRCQQPRGVRQHPGPCDVRHLPRRRVDRHVRRATWRHRHTLGACRELHRCAAGGHTNPRRRAGPDAQHRAGATRAAHGR